MKLIFEAAYFNELAENDEVTQPSHKVSHFPRGKMLRSKNLDSTTLPTFQHIDREEPNGVSQSLVREGGRRG